MNHDKMSTMDKLWLIGELEHIRKHCIRSAFSASKDEDIFFYIVCAKQAMDARRAFQAKHFPDVTELDWCLIKASMATKQLLYETMLEDDDISRQIERLTDSLLSHATGEDLSGCQACREDKGEDNDQLS